MKDAVTVGHGCVLAAAFGQDPSHYTTSASSLRAARICTREAYCRYGRLHPTQQLELARSSHGARTEFAWILRTAYSVVQKTPQVDSYLSGKRSREAV